MKASFPRGLRAMDTSPEAHAMQMELLRQASPGRRLRLMCQLTATTMNTARRRLEQLHPEWSKEEVDVEFTRVHHGAELAGQLRREYERRGLL